MRSIQGLKDDLVVELYLGRGTYWEAVEKARKEWLINDPPVQLPPESEDILLPPCLGGARDLSELHAVWAHHPDLPPLMGGPRDDPASYTVWVSNWDIAYSNLKRHWELDLKLVLNAGVPEKYLKESPPRIGSPPLSEALVPWYRFAAACVLYNPPGEALPAFAEYGGRAIPGVLTRYELQEQRVQRAVCDAIDAAVFEKAWELRGELPDDLNRAKAEVHRRFLDELVTEEDQVREELELHFEEHPTPPYYVAFDPKENTNKTVEKKLSAIRAKEGLTPPGGRPPINRLVALWCAVLYHEHNPRNPTDRRSKHWTYEKMADKLKKFGVRNKRSAEEHVKVGERLRQTRRKNL